MTQNNIKGEYMGNSKLSNAKKEKNDEFYTQYNGY